MKERLINLFGENNLEKTKNTHILLVGIGGVGSFCFETLIRCGVENITVIDFDTYEESNLNRQLYATLDTLGKKKIDTALIRAKSINENVIKKTINEISTCDLLIIGGTSLNVYPAASFINYFRGRYLVLINKSITQYDHICNLVIHDSIGKVFESIEKSLF